MKIILFFNKKIFETDVKKNPQLAITLLFAFRESWSNVAVPIIDSIDPDTFKYKASPLGKSNFLF